MIKPMRIGFVLVIFLAQIQYLGTFAQGSEVQVKPQIRYSDNSGLNFAATTAKWSTKTSSTFQWYVNGVAVKGATKLQFTAKSSQRNQSIFFKESVKGSPNSSTSSNVAKIGQIIVNQPPEIFFKDSNKRVLQVTKSETSPIDVKVSYQWTRGPIEIVGATGSEYLLSTADFGSRLSVVVIFKRKGFTTNSVYTNFIETPNFKRNYIETWREDFNMEVGSYPQSKIWTPDVGDGSNTAAGGGWGNRERQYYIPEQAKTNQFGELVIQATRKNASNYSCYYREACEWISAKYTTKGKIGFKYGRIEARIKGPLGLGTWGAFWMLGADIDERRWPWCGEIDVTELVGKDPNIAYGYLHGLLSGGMGGRGSTVPIPGGFADDFHVYAIDWLPDQINWYVDDVLFGSQSKIDRDWVFDHEFYLIFNLAMGGNLGGPIDLNLESAEMKLDWIRFSTINGIGEVIRHS